MHLFDHHSRHLARLDKRKRLRALAPRAGVDFSSNDYLGLAASEELREAALKGIGEGVPLGSGGSRLLRGNCPEHAALEDRAAQVFGAESALYFANGFVANMALLSTLPMRGDMIFYDALVHASAHDGMRLGRAEKRAFPHNDTQALDAMLAEWRQGDGEGTAWIAVEGLYSMDGDKAPLLELKHIADRHGAILLIDEAHATGVYGTKGEGLAGDLHSAPNVLTLHTLGKALGCEGALVCGPRVLREFLVNRARAFIFSTAPSPFSARIALRALELLEEQPERRERLHALIAHAESKLSPLGVSPLGTQIIPVILGDDARTMRLAEAVQQEGYDVRGIRPPTVPEGTSRLRISLTLNASESDIDGLAAVLEEQLCLGS